MMPTRCLRKTRTPNNSGFALFGNLSVTTVLRKSEIQAYLTLPVENVKDPLKWWRANKHIYPNLHRMAQDYISIPGKSSHYIFCIKITIGRIATSTPSNVSSLKVVISSHLRARASHPLQFMPSFALVHGRVVGLCCLATSWRLCR